MPSERTSVQEERRLSAGISPDGDESPAIKIGGQVKSRPMEQRTSARTKPRKRGSLENPLFAILCSEFGLCRDMFPPETA
jgi:hypothetical protein